MNGFPGVCHEISTFSTFEEGDPTRHHSVNFSMAFFSP